MTIGGFGFTGTEQVLHCMFGDCAHGVACGGGGGGWHKASVSDCLSLAAPIGLSPLLILTLCGPERVGGWGGKQPQHHSHQATAAFRDRFSPVAVPLLVLGLLRGSLLSGTGLAGWALAGVGVRMDTANGALPQMLFIHSSMARVAQPLADGCQ